MKISKTKEELVNMYIDSLNPNLRAIDNIDGKERKREFYELSADDAYEILLGIAIINGMEKNVVLVEQSDKEINEEEQAEEGRTKTLLPRMDWLIEQKVVNIGDKVFIINHPEDVAEIVDADNVLYKGRKISFNKYGCEVTGWKAIQIYAFMKILNGPDETLSSLREKKMAELGMLK